MGVSAQHPTFQAVRERKGKIEIVKLVRGAMREGDMKSILVRFWQRGLQTMPSFGFGDLLWTRSANERDKWHLSNEELTITS